MKGFKKYLSWALILLTLAIGTPVLASQHDYEITTADANTGVTYRAAVNAALQALASLSSGVSEPATPYAYQLWADTTNDLLKIRNSANTAWLTIGTLGEAYLGLLPDSYLDIDGTLTANSDSKIATQKATKAYVDTTVSGVTSLAHNIKPVVNVAVNKLDVLTKSGGAVPNATHFFTIAIPDGNGYTARTRKAAYLSGTSQIILANATNYWSKGELASEIKTAWLYAIWDGTGIVWALGGYSGFNKVSTTTTATDDDYLLLEDGSTYTRNAAHYCVAVAKIRYEYDTSDDPDHTIQATVEDSPRVIWNPKSDYAKVVTLATTISAASDIAEQAVITTVVKQSGRYLILCTAMMGADDQSGYLDMYIKTGSGTYGSATAKLRTRAHMTDPAAYAESAVLTGSVIVYLTAGDSIHLGGQVQLAGVGTRYIHGNDGDYDGSTAITFARID